jgi:hypothetical protein
MTRYKIKTAIGFVSGFNRYHQIVQVSVAGALYTKASLAKFIQNHSGCGFGFDINDCTIVEVII